MGKGDAAAHLRPTSDRVREAVFSILQGGRMGDPINGAVVLDLFAGTGALGLEALSRGANFVHFVENGKVGQKLIRANLGKLGRQADAELLTIDALNLPEGTPCELIFLDPPYGQDLGRAALAAAAKAGRLKQGAIVVWEEDTAQIAPPDFTQCEQRRFGDTWVTFLRYAQ